MKLNHTDFYLSGVSHHHPAHKQAVLSTLVCRSQVVSGAQNLAVKLNHLRLVSQHNGYYKFEMDRDI